MAWNAADLLIARVERPDLAAALSPFTLVVGTTSRPAPPARVIPPREAAAAVSDHLSRDPGATAALLFGQEDIGLTREVQSRCHLIGSIPVSTDYPSLNLAQAALVFLYELRLALSASPTPRDATDDTAPPSQDRMEAFFERLESTLEAIDFFQGTARSHMMRELRALFNRAVMTRRELAIFEGIVHRVDLTRRKGSRGPGAPPPLSGP